MPVASVGETASHEVQVTAEAIDAFAELSGDENPIHLDDAYAAETMFGGRVAHGMLSAAAVSAALASLPGDIIYLEQELTFDAPVRPGEAVRAAVEVVEDLGGDRLRVRTEAFVDARDERVLDGEATVLSLAHEE
ncbi:MaoC/PaaZ C-terminal domain-containing protein [Halorubrum sp. CBA1229]|jgi:3-hydroxybutyryl-CoA dehydratase|uniref:MaoC/PaaZ C-terminal domain-containing protein n=1 Tax=Halorubrum sp. CBA1229 TaxID=1853699 RepID=UPI000F410A40|nr:MaoC/PaaZ C-terminal domain-containing protein [Halorubrum sp. CBA1229]QKY17941.1 MaoC family dehydratase N-terminal domain-containing protein [Halorubrum sp. CBA1229]